MLSAGLIDRLLLMTFPVLLGKGKSIFEPSQQPKRMKLTDHYVSGNGVVFTIYEPNGDVETGSFATKPPSQAELELRERIKEGAW